ncbi:ADP-ribosyl cyclase/cyclic ADP-ribose hydrolase 1-like [Chanos chanos]|uniref:ADP-ribosyl cyclase/cyclic ADP-ribose hydrolase n=1 Tax=Chanos chanos TaxID=29144 RepID=A0A6J2USZ2_CHACN|nr:ADP-ribosyl cyclase/cyclic ADP-ribose hydrolase 1-like [Chanos chanos]
MSRITAGLVVLLFLTGYVNTGPGTTPHLKQIVIGRCYDYVTLVKPSSRYNCEEIWREFEEAVIRRDPCSVRVKDYRRMFRLTPQSLPCDKLLFWSKTRGLMHSYSAVTRRFLTLEDTLVGYIFNDLIWCGQEERDRGFDYNSCPEWSTCVNHPVYSLWKQASQNFATAACGNITVLLNGSIPNAFNRKSMFGSVELDNLNPRMVSFVNLKVVPNLEGPFVESCSQGSILDLIKILETRGFRWTCTDKDEYVPTVALMLMLTHLVLMQAADSFSSVWPLDTDDSPVCEEPKTVFL